MVELASPSSRENRDFSSAQGSRQRTRPGHSAVGSSGGGGGGGAGGAGGGGGRRRGPVGRACASVGHVIESVSKVLTGPCAGPPKAPPDRRIQARLLHRARLLTEKERVMFLGSRRQLMRVLGHDITSTILDG